MARRHDGVLDGSGAVAWGQQVEVQPVEVLLARPERHDVGEEGAALPLVGYGDPEDAIVSGFLPHGMCRQCFVEELRDVLYAIQGLLSLFALQQTVPRLDGCNERKRRRCSESC